MWTWVIVAYLAILVAVAGCAGYVALFVADERRAARAYRVLVAAIAAITGGGGLFAAMVRLHELGLLDSALGALTP